MPHMLTLAATPCLKEIVKKPAAESRVDFQLHHQ